MPLFSRCALCLKQKMRSAIIFCLFLVSPFWLWGQADSGTTLREFVFSDYSLQRRAPQEAIATIEKQEDLGRNLSLHRGIFVRQYGPGLLQSFSLNGTGSNHTAVVWNGFNLQSPVNGQFDLSLISTAMFDSYQVSQQGTSVRYGSGALAGAVEIINDHCIKHPVEIGARVEIGSFGMSSQQAKIAIQNGRFYSSSRFFYKKATNDLVFKNRTKAYQPEERLKNAEYELGGLMQNFAFVFNKKLAIKSGIWVQEARRNIPDIIIKNEGKAKQQDRDARLSAELQYAKNAHVFLFRSAWFQNLLNYEDENTNQQSALLGRSFIAEAIHKMKGRKFAIQNILNQTLNYAFSDNLNPNRLLQKRFSAASLIQLDSVFKPNFNHEFGIRLEQINAQTAPVLWSYSSAYAMRNFHVKAGLARVFRFPTLNDFYWFEGGNPDLKPEKGYSAHFGLQKEFTKGKFYHKFYSQVFLNRINNWILWQPKSGFRWTPKNVLEVFSRGASWSYDLKLNVNKLAELSMAYNGTYTKAEIIKTHEPQDQSLHKQLVYMPYWMHHATVSVKRLGFESFVRMNYNGISFTASDNSEYLPAFVTLDAGFSLPFQTKLGIFHGEFRMNNITNTYYELMPLRPMPGLNFQVALNWEINKHLNIK
jgi:iron complex outermembrane receptor protein